MDEEIELADDLYPEDAAMYRYALDMCVSPVRSEERERGER